MSNFVMGLAACANACTPCARSSALLMDGCRGFDFKRGMNPPLKFPRGNWASRDFEYKARRLVDRRAIATRCLGESEFGRQVAVDFESDAGFHECGS
jgi:hypothetical protein